MKRKIIALFIAIVLIALVIAVNPVAAQLCMANPTETLCVNEPGCYWCGTIGVCNPFPECPTCNQFPVSTCMESPECHWCPTSMMCYPDARPCTCGNQIVDDDTPEQCDSGRFCTNDCLCPVGYENDGGNGCKPIVGFPVCGNGILETGEECEPAYSRYCDFVTCTCMPGFIPDPAPENLGFCILAPCVPTTEVCDGVDNDCDSSVDEDLGSTTCGLLI